MSKDDKKIILGFRRSEMSLLVAIALGLVIGTLIKKVRVGIMLGLIIGLGIMFLNNLRAKK
ncbi:MAG: hypothetical protein QM727_12445 [Niabella sp.]